MDFSPFVGSICTLRANTSNVSVLALQYEVNTLPTPWPILVTSIGISFLISLYGFLTSNKSADTRLTLIIEPIIAVVNTIRAVTAFVSALMAITVQKARFQSPSALAAMLLAVLPSIVQRNEKLKRLKLAYIGVINVFLVVLANIFASLLSWVLTFTGKRYSYALMNMNGGYCVKNQLQCHLEVFGSIAWVDGNAIGLEEYILADTFLGIILLVLIANIIPLMKRFVYRNRRDYFFDTFKIWPVDIRYTSNRRRIQLITLIWITIYACISLPVHITQERISKTYSLADVTTDQVLIDQWSGCPNVTSPTDALGFLSGWWQEYRTRLEAILPVT
jgi:hypothetical protein